MENIILITGATSGIGQAMAQIFWNNGWKVIGTGRRKSKLEEMAAGMDGRFLPLDFDIGNRQEVEQKLGNIPADFAEISVLVNNAGIALGGNLAPETLLDDWERMISTNILGMLYCTRLLLPGMVKRKRGHIVTIGSCVGTRPARTANVYAASKAFVRSFSDNLRADLLGTPIRVTCLSPGRTRTEFSIVRTKGVEEEASKDYAKGEPLVPRDIAEALWWVVNCPARMDVTQIEILPVTQADGGPVIEDIH